MPNAFGPLDKDLVDKKLYRTADVWRTTELRSFKKKLYDKIDKSDFVNPSGWYYQ